MKAGTSLDENHRRQVEAVLEKYPFFALGRMMVAKIATHTGDPQASQLRFLASLYAPSRQYYAFFLEERLRPRVSPPPKTPAPSAREGSPPAPSTSSQEEPSANDEPGPADMALSSAFWPPLQGWVAARQILYAPVHMKLVQQLRFPEPVGGMSEVPSPSPVVPAEAPESPILTESPPTPPPLETLALPSDTPAKPLRDAPFPASASSEAPPIVPESETRPLDPPSIAASNPISTVDLPPLSAPRLPPALSSLSSKLPIPLIQFELLPGGRPSEPKGPPTSGFTLEEPPAPPTIELQASAALSPPPPPPTESLSETLPLSPSEPSPSEVTELPSEPLSALSRTYVPLENPEGVIHPASAETSVMSAESTLHRPFIPLENPDALIHLPAEPSSAPAAPSWIYVSESPIRPLIPFEIDIEASIHLPVPEPTEGTPSLVESSLGPSAVQEEGTSRMSESVASDRESLQKPWQSFLREIELQVPISELKISPLSKELENLRRAFIRQLLEQRPTESLRAQSPEVPNLIDRLIEKLQSFPKSPSVEGPPELSAPARETPPQQPRIYTETMAKLYWSQGDLPRAIQVYEALCEKHPEKAAYYQNQIARIRAGEAP